MIVEPDRNVRLSRPLHCAPLTNARSAVFGIHNNGINLAVKLVILFLAVIWIALIYWTYSDARRRIADPLVIGCATATAFFPFVGTIVYMIVRPPEYLEDVRERELEMQAAEARLAEFGYHLCPHCDAEVEKDFLRCPNCMRKLKDPCRTAASRWTPCGRSARIARRRSADHPGGRSRRRRRRASAARSRRRRGAAVGLL